MNAQLFNESLVSEVDRMPADMATQLQPAPPNMLAHPLVTLQRTVIKFTNFWGLERVIIAGSRGSISLLLACGIGHTGHYGFL
jgi:hypothetical protein